MWLRATKVYGKPRPGLKRAGIFGAKIVRGNRLAKQTEKSLNSVRKQGKKVEKIADFEDAGVRFEFSGRPSTLTASTKFTWN